MGEPVGTLHAWVDESMRIDTGDKGAYVLASVVCDPACCDPIRDELRSLRLKRQQRLHWRDEDANRRTKIAETFGQVNVTAVVVVGEALARSKQERGRRACMRSLFPYLDQLGVNRVFLETRTASLQRRDAKMIDALRAQQLLSPRLQVEVARPLEEPMLWIADVLAGATSAALAGQEEWLEPMRHLTTQIRVPLR